MVDASKLARWQCHKVVSAGKIVELYWEEFERVGCITRLLVECADGSTEVVGPDRTLLARYVPELGDYYVVYSDGYASISPAKAFEEGYTRI